jgi:hypothetical protein
VPLPSASASRAAGWALRRLLVGALCVGVAAGCAAQLDAPSVTAVPGREDLTVMSYRAHVAAGLSDAVTVELPDGIDAALIEVAGDRGQFRLAQLSTPSGRDAVEAGGFVTRDAREVDGLVDWLYPNSPTQQLEGGRYTLRFTALGAGGRVVDDEDVTVRLYTRASAGAGGAIKLDVFVADDAIAGGVDDLAAALVTRVAALYAQAGVSIADYTAATVRLGASDLALDGGRLSAPSLSMLQAALRGAGARADAVHLVIVRGLDDGGDAVAGYSLGLPGPFAAERPTAAVLVSAAPFVAPSTGALDTEGLGTTAAHEVGHYLGLYHTSERDGMEHDPIADTPECAAGASACPDASNVMFWTGGGGRSKLTAGQGVVMRRHPLVIAAAPPPLPAADCHGPCNAGDTCVVLGGQSVCATACDPQTLPCDSGRCAPSDDGTYVCRAD